MLESSDPQKQRAFRILFPFFRKMIDACPNTNPVHPLFYAKGIPIKIFRQTCTVSAILRPIPLPLFEKETIGDADSIQVIARSILESYLIFHRLYVSPKTESESEFWWLAWALKSLVDRVKKMNPKAEEFPVSQYDEKTGIRSVKSGKETRQGMERNIEEIKSMITKNEYYKLQLLNPDKTVVKNFKTWSARGWQSSPSELLKEANMRYFTSWHIYSVFSAAAHTDHISVKQMLLTKGHKEQMAYAEASLNIILMVMGRLCLELPKPFPAVKDILEKEHDVLTQAISQKVLSESESEADIRDLVLETVSEHAKHLM